MNSCYKWCLVVVALEVALGREPVERSSLASRRCPSQLMRSWYASCVEVLLGLHWNLFYWQESVALAGRVCDAAVAAQKVQQELGAQAACSASLVARQKHSLPLLWRPVGLACSRSL